MQMFECPFVCVRHGFTIFYLFFLSCLSYLLNYRFYFSSCPYASLLHDNILGETEPVGESPMEVLSTPRAIQEIMRINDTLKSARNFNSSIGGGGGGGGGSGVGLDFLGCMPINLSRRNLLNVQR